MYCYALINRDSVPLPILLERSSTSDSKPSDDGGQTSTKVDFDLNKEPDQE